MTRRPDPYLIPEDVVWSRVFGRPEARPMLSMMEERGGDVAAFAAEARLRCQRFTDWCHTGAIHKDAR